MIDVERPEQPAGPAAAGGRRRSPARRRTRARRKARLRIGATAALAVIAAGGTVIATSGDAMAAGSSSPSTTAPSPTVRPFSVSGVLRSVGKNSLAFKLSDGTVATATLTSKTVYTKSENLKPSALSNGKRVTVTGTTKDGVLAATRIVVTSAIRGAGFGPGAGGFRPGGGGAARGSLPANFRPRAGGLAPRSGARFPAGGNFAFGTISGLSGGSFTLTEFNNDKVKVTTTSSTGVTETVRTTKKGLKVGQELFITGREVNNTTVAAASVSQGTAGLGPFGRFGPGGAGPRGAGPGGGTTSAGKTTSVG